MGLIDPTTTTATDKDVENVDNATDAVMRTLLPAIDTMLATVAPLGSMDDRAVRGMVISRIIKDYLARYPGDAPGLLELVAGSVLAYGEM